MEVRVGDGGGEEGEGSRVSFAPSDPVGPRTSLCSSLFFVWHHFIPLGGQVSGGVPVRVWEGAGWGWGLG